MSGKIMGQVWDLDLPHNKLIVLLAMTDHADHEGNNIFPSMELIAWKTGYSERQVRRIIQSLEKDKLLVKTSRPGYTNMYAVNLSAGKQKAPFTSAKTTPDKMSDPMPKQNVTPDIVMSDQIGHLDVRPTPDIQMSDEPSLKPSINYVADGKVISMTDVMEKQEPKKKTRTEKQAYNDMLVATLGKALGVEAVGDDYGIYAKNAQKLVRAGIPPDEFGRFVKRLRAKARPGFEINVRTIVAGGSMSEYVAARNAYQQSQSQQATPKTVHDEGIALMLSWLEEKPA
jgi:hypothetical protein